MAPRFQLTIDCRDPYRLTRFWASALHYDLEPPPDGFDNWNDYWRSLGVPDEELDLARDSCDSIVDPAGSGPRIAFQPVPEDKTVKNRLHLDLDATAGRHAPLETRRQQVLAEVARLEGEGARQVQTFAPVGMNHFHVLMQDPEGNEFCVR